ncbi:MAG: hypothetical protein JXA69_06520, partial [Phycisphaerae bacterium]|nr:hypothetical protein [Phycisphaerae bacterium]
MDKAVARPDHTGLRRIEEFDGPMLWAKAGIEGGMNKSDWLNLVAQKEWETLEDRWMAAVEDPNAGVEGMIAALEALAKQKQDERAATLAWMWLSVVKARAEASEVLELAREIILHGTSEQVRKEVASLYQEVFADRPGVEELITASGLLGGKSPRRALRTLELCLQAEPGTCLISRGDAGAAEVVEADLAGGRFVVRTRRGTTEYDADTLANEYDLADPNDFRVLTELHPERFASLLADDPAGLVVGIVRAHGGKMDADDLKYMLTPTHMSADAWSKWWTRVRSALKRHHHVRVEGRTPVTLMYDEAGVSLEDEVREQWAKVRTPEQQISIIDGYVREAKSRKTPVDKALLQDWARALSKRIEKHHGHPAEALRPAIVLEHLHRSGYVASEQASLVEALLANAADLAALLKSHAESSVLPRLLEAARAAVPERWPAAFLEIFPTCSPDNCDAVVAHLVEAGHRDAVQQVIGQIAMEPLEHLPLLVWLWRGPAKADVFDLPPRVEVLGRMLTLLGDLARREDVRPDVHKEVRATIRSALAARKHAAFHEAIEGMEADLAGTVYRQLSRAAGLSHALVDDLCKIVRQKFPVLFMRPRLEPWEDPNILYTTDAGRRKAEEELNYILHVKMPENAKAIGEAASHGDLSENSEYKFALEERDLLRARAAGIQ